MVRKSSTTFTIKIATKSKNKVVESRTVLSRKCYAIVTKINDEFRAIINVDKNNSPRFEGDEFSNSQLVLPFTENSFDLKNKTHVFSKHKDKNGRYFCVIRKELDCKLNPGCSDQYSALKDKLLIAGRIIRINGKMYFEYETIIKYNYLYDYKINSIKINEDKPLFIK